MKSNLLIAAFVAVLGASFAAAAADDMAKEKTAVPEKAQQQHAKKKAKPHSHMAEKGVMAPSSDSSAAKEQPKRPAHDHTTDRK